MESRIYKETAQENLMDNFEKEIINDHERNGEIAKHYKEIIHGL